MNAHRRKEAKAARRRARLARETDGQFISRQNKINETIEAGVKKVLPVEGESDQPVAASAPPEPVWTDLRRAA